MGMWERTHCFIEQRIFRETSQRPHRSQSCSLNLGIDCMCSLVTQANLIHKQALFLWLSQKILRMVQRCFFLFPNICLPPPHTIHISFYTTPLPYTLWNEPLSGPILNRGHFPSFADFCKTQWISLWCPEASYLPGKHHPGWKARDPVHPAGQLQPPLPGPGFASYDFVVTMPFVSPRMWGSALMLPWSWATFRPFYHTDTLLEDETQGKSFTLYSESTPIKVTPNFLFVQKVCSICLIGKEIMHSHLLFQPIHYHHKKGTPLKNLSARSRLSSQWV